jgi:mRNA interferase YafQ
VYTVVESQGFQRSYLKLARSGKLKERIRTELESVIETLRRNKPLAARNRDHALKGDWLGFRECHIKGDLLLICEKRENVLVLVLVDIGTHSELFG